MLLSDFSGVELRWHWQFTAGDLSGGGVQKKLRSLDVGTRHYEIMNIGVSVLE